MLLICFSPPYFFYLSIFNDYSFTIGSDGIYLCPCIINRHGNFATDYSMSVNEGAGWNESLAVWWDQHASETLNFHSAASSTSSHLPFWDLACMLFFAGCLLDEQMQGEVTFQSGDTCSPHIPELFASQVQLIVASHPRSVRYKEHAAKMHHFSLNSNTIYN